jgi:hypothetical protein
MLRRKEREKKDAKNILLIVSPSSSLCVLASLPEISRFYPKMYLESAQHSYYYAVKFDANSEN